MRTEIAAQGVEWAAAGAVAMGASAERPVLFRRPDWVTGGGPRPVERPRSAPGQMRTERGPGADGQPQATAQRPTEENDYSGAISYLAAHKARRR